MAKLLFNGFYNIPISIQGVLNCMRIDNILNVMLNSQQNLLNDLVLQPGQIINATVHSKNSSQFILALAGKLISFSSNVDLPLGEEIQLKVKEVNNNQYLLEILKNTIKTESKSSNNQISKLLPFPQQMVQELLMDHNLISLIYFQVLNEMKGLLELHGEKEAKAKYHDKHFTCSVSLNMSNLKLVDLNFTYLPTKEIILDIICSETETVELLTKEKDTWQDKLVEKKLKINNIKVKRVEEAKATNYISIDITI